VGRRGEPVGMRITGGALKGRRLPEVKGFTGRPTTDFGRESLFNVLGNKVDFEELDVLDLFAGTGMVSLEFASRGARTVTAVEKDVRAVRAMAEAFEKFGCAECEALRGDALDFIRRAPAAFGLVFADPPYDLPDLARLPALVRESGLLPDGGWFVLEHGERTDVSGEAGFIECRHYGHVHFSFFEYPAPLP